MRFIVTGADADTGEDIELAVEAKTSDEAQSLANRKGVMVSRVQPASPKTIAPPHQNISPPPIEQGHQRGAPVLNVAMPRRGSSLGVASIILGILAFLICWIPLVNLISVPLSALGLLLGLVGLVVAITRKGSSIGLPIAGSAISGLALLVVVATTGLLVGGITRAANEAAERAAAASKAGTAGVLPSQNEQWPSADSVIRHGDVELRILEAKIGHVPLTPFLGRTEERQTDEALLRIEIEIANVSQTKKIDYLSFNADDEQRLTDNFGNTYRLVDFGSLSSRPIGSVRVGPIYPGEKLRDVLVFQVPIDRAEHLDLDLPGVYVDGDGRIRVRIPASMIQR
jgi:hypothetical protein